MRLNFLVCAALAVSAAPLSAQAVHGRIVGDSAAVPMENVIVTLLNIKGDSVEPSVRTDESGKFVLRTKDPGRYYLKATRLAFEPVSTAPFDLTLRGMIEARLVMTKQTVLLSPMVVVASRVMTGADMMSVEGFEWRRRRMIGTFIDTATMRKSGYPPFSSLLTQLVPGVYVVPGFTGGPEFRMNTPRGECVPDIYRDGSLQGTMVVSHLNNTNSADFYGVEVFRGTNIPLEYRRGSSTSVAGTMSGFDCGVISLWTKWHASGRGAGANAGVSGR